MILLIDNYDSFSYNLYQLIGEIEPDIKVIRNDEMTVEEIRKLSPTKLFFHQVREDQREQASLWNWQKPWQRDSTPRCLPCHQAICAA